jgi:glycosyltransferase involved in cell wall biosynthesis
MKIIKHVGKKLWILLNSAIVFLAKKNPTISKSDIKVYYGGAYKGDKGGPLVKVKRLAENFPEHRFDFNLLYCLSNSPYLSEGSLERIKQRNIPIILNQNGVYFSGWYGKGWQKQNEKLKPAYHLADYVFWQSEFCQKAADKFLGKRKNSSEILYNAVDIMKFSPIDKVNKEFTFLTTGVFSDSMLYRLVATIEAFYLFQKKHKDTRLTIAGFISKKTKAQINDLISARELEKKITVSGSYSQVNAPSIYANSDAYIMLKHMDASPNVIIEAMACGLPIVYSASGGVSELVGQKAGIGLSIENRWESKPHAPEPQLISEAMSYIMGDQKAFSIHARSRAVGKFNIKNWMTRHEEVFLKYAN